jgi:hypothetical protein
MAGPEYTLLMQRQDEQLAVRLTEIKPQQLLAAQDWYIKSEGKAHDFELWDPLTSVVGYLRGLKEYRSTGRWEKGEATHEKAKNLS